jgi:maltose O-acetyltransferase
VIGAGSVVTRDVPEGVVAAGNPCRVIRAISE